MSVVTYHEVAGNNIFDRLVEEGVIHEGDIYSPRRGEYIHFDNIFDYTKCDEKTLAELDERNARRTARYIERLNEMDYTDEEKATKIAENNKCDRRLMPVFKSKCGGVGWTLNYSYDDLPSVAIGRRYPDDIFEYYQSTEGHLDVSCYFKNESNVTPDGKPYVDVIRRIPDKLITEQEDGSMAVRLYLDPTDQRPAIIYCNKADIIPCDFRAEHAWQDGYSGVAIRDKDKEIPVYRILEDGTKTKENWSVNDINDAVNRSREEYKKNLRRAESNVGVEDHEPVEAQDLEV